LTGWLVAAVLAVALAAVLGVSWRILAFAVVFALLAAIIVRLLNALARNTSIWR
jgi:hypothetical protein